MNETALIITMILITTISLSVFIYFIVRRIHQAKQTDNAFQLARDQTNRMIFALRRIDWLNQYFHWYYDQGGKNNDEGQIMQYLREYVAFAKGYRIQMSKWKESLDNALFECNNLVASQNIIGGAANTGAFDVYARQKEINRLYQTYNQHQTPPFDNRFLQLATSYFPDLVQNLESPT